MLWEHALLIHFSRQTDRHADGNTSHDCRAEGEAIRHFLIDDLWAIVNSQYYDSDRNLHCGEQTDDVSSAPLKLRPYGAIQIRLLLLLLLLKLNLHRLTRPDATRLFCRVGGVRYCFERVQTSLFPSRDSPESSRIRPSPPVPTRKKAVLSGRGYELGS